MRHAHATSGDITLRRREHELELVVTDDGVGIAQPYVSGIGITSMRSRVQALGGTFELTPRPGGGTDPAGPGAGAVMIKVVVVDDHAVFREGVRALLARVDEIEVVGEAGTTDEAIAIAAEVEPDVILMDLNIPGGGGESATVAILADRPETAVLMLTMYTDATHLRGALQAGARGYLVKDAEPTPSCGRSRRCMAVR